MLQNRNLCHLAISLFVSLGGQTLVVLWAYMLTGLKAMQMGLQILWDASYRILWVWLFGCSPLDAKWNFYSHQYACIISWIMDMKRILSLRWEVRLMCTLREGNTCKGRCYAFKMAHSALTLSPMLLADAMRVVFSRSQVFFFFFPLSSWMYPKKWLRVSFVMWKLFDTNVS